MAGKRVLDAANLLNAARAIASQHAKLRREQWSLWTKTSSLAQAVKSQTDRVTVTVQAARELGKRFGDDGQVWSGDVEKRKENVARRVREGLEVTGSARQDVFGDGPGMSAAGAEGKDATSAGTQYAAANAIGGESREAEADDGTLSALRKRELQRRAEFQIPAVSADEQSPVSAKAGEDTFNERADHTSPGLSSLPRMKLPKHPGDTQGGDDHVQDRQINQEVFYSNRNQPQEQEAAPEGMNLDVFSTPKISKMLGEAGEMPQNPYAGRQKLPPKPLPEMVAAGQKWEIETPSSPDRQSTRMSASESDSALVGDAETQRLAQSLAEETQTQHEPAADLNHTTMESPQYEMRESRVPSSRFGRLWQYGGLATSMAFGAVNEGFRRFTGSGAEGSIVLSEANVTRLVAKLSRMRGAALKLGQMMSFQDSKVLPSTINAVLQRVQDSADYMPPFQRDGVLEGSLGTDWRSLFSQFEEKPFAAASIGQVHRAVLASNGQEVAVKVQYPGVRNSIDSDLNNLSLLLTASRLLPKGLYLDKTIANARLELGWECDYEREAEACTRFKELVADEEDTFAVPTVYTEASGRDVLTAEYMRGTAVTKVQDLDQNERDWIGTQILRLCLRELMEWRFMQTDPNWTNFLYNRSTRKLELLDFGASRAFPDQFVEPYVSLLIAASRKDRDACRDLSIQLGYLTGHESKEMLVAHVDSIMTLAEPFMTDAPEVYDFRDQSITDRVRANIGLMLRERMAPPPEETYSLHRKLSGAFLLCARLQSQIRTRDMFATAVEVWNGREQKVPSP